MSHTATAAPDDLESLLRRMIEAICDHPQDVSLYCKPLRGRLEFHVMPNINDQGPIVGKGGAHIKALQYLVRVMGERRGEQAVIFLHEDEEGVRELPRKRKPATADYDTQPALDLLSDTLFALLENVPHIACVPTRHVMPPDYTINITPFTRADYSRLLDPDEAGDDMTVITALGTLFRAAGKRDGVGFRLAVKE